MLKTCAVTPRKRPWSYYLKRDKFFYLLLALPILYYIVYKYMPMFGIVIAFQDYKPFLGVEGIFSAEWVGLKHFERFFSSINCGRLIRNTFLISFYSLIFAFPSAILLALLLNEVKCNKFKRVVQTVSYLPHFLSAVIVCGMVRQLLTVDGGLVNTIINAFGGEPIYFLGSTRFYRTYYVASGVWQSIGWSSIVYLAAMGNIDTSLYEAAELDGAGIIKKMWYVTLPALLPIISITLILQVGSLLSVGHEKTLLLYSTLNYEVSDIIVLTYTAKDWWACNIPTPPRWTCSLPWSTWYWCFPATGRPKRWAKRGCGKCSSACPLATAFSRSQTTSSCWCLPS